MINADRVAVIAAHPDDEVLGFGGTAARHAAAGAEVRFLILGTGLVSRGGSGREEVAGLRNQSRKAADILGVAAIEFADFPDNSMDSLPMLNIVQRIEAFLTDFPANWIYTHHAGDLNIDHRITHLATVTACRPLPGIAKRVLLAGEVNSSTEWSGPSLPPFIPTEYVDIEATLERKLAALACYEGELREWPHPRSLRGIQAQAEFRGCQAGLTAAEAFMTIRRVS